MENYYEYFNNETIEKNLICDICYKPFIQPVTTSSGNIFCRLCIEQKVTDKKELIPLTDSSLLHALDTILVKCKLCNEENIIRVNFEEHMIKQCPKAIVICPASENNCSWIGLREELHMHLNICSYEPLIKTSENKLNQNLIGKFFPFSNINFQERNFHNQDAAIAAKALIINKRSTCLDLFNKGISSKGAFIIASVLHNDTYLETLSLRNNLI